MNRPAFWLIVLLLAIVPSLSPQATPENISTPPPDKWTTEEVVEAIISAADEFGIPLEMAINQALAESGMDPSGKPSPKNARGLFQILAKYQDEMVRYYLRIDPSQFDVWNPYDNARLAMAIMRALKDEFGDWWGACAAYNCGRARYVHFVTAEEPLPRETIYYLKKIFGGTRGLERKLG